MTHYDVFNGDADGLCALHQLRLDNPIESELITGVKRDIDLLKQVPDSAQSVTVLDVSLDKNREALQRLLDADTRITYIDHHFPGEVPNHPNLSTTIETAATVCTGLLVNGHLKGAYLPWAVTAAYGDNLNATAEQAATPLGLSDAALADLKQLGTLMNYNGYGATLDDLWFTPTALYQAIKPHSNPFTFIREDTAFETLRDGHAADTEKTENLAPSISEDHIAVYELPDAPWARRVSGDFANALANRHPDRAHALLTEKPGGYLVSVRAPLARREGADAVCRQFDTGGGRAAAAGINTLPPEDVNRFIDSLRAAYADT